jgi:hypothetical protein
MFEIGINMLAIHSSDKALPDLEVSAQPSPAQAMPA